MTKGREKKNTALLWKKKTAASVLLLPWQGPYETYSFFYLEKVMEHEAYLREWTSLPQG